MLCKNYALYVLVNRHRKKKGMPPLSRRRFCQIAATSSAALAMPSFLGCTDDSSNNAVDAGSGLIGQGGISGKAAQSGTGGVVAQSGSGGTVVQGGSGGIMAQDAAQDGGASTGTDANTEAGTDAGTEAGTVSYDEWDYTDDTDMTVAPQPDYDPANGLYHSYTPEQDTRAMIDENPAVELNDYTGPFRPDLKYTDFSRKFLSHLYSMGHHYHYRIQRGYRQYVYQTWGNDAVANSEEKIWGEITADDNHTLYRDVMKITGNDLESFIKSWQIDLNMQPGDFWEVIIEMPTTTQALVTVNECPVMKEYEERGSTTEELLAVCRTKCHSAIQSKAKLYDSNIELKVLTEPALPRASTNNICCKLALRYLGDTFQDDWTPNLAKDPSKQDLRADTTTEPIAVPLEDYSGAFNPELRMTDFSRQQLARMFLMGHQHDLNMMIGYQDWAMTKYGWKEMVVMPVGVWADILWAEAHEVHSRFLNLTGESLENYMKGLQCDITAQPPNFDHKFEILSPDRVLYTFNKCFGETNLKSQGAPPDKVLEFCEMDPPAIRRCATLYHPKARVKIMALPPVLYDDQVACKWDIYVPEE